MFSLILFSFPANAAFVPVSDSIIKPTNPLQILTLAEPLKSWYVGHFHPFQHMVVSPTYPPPTISSTPQLINFNSKHLHRYLSKPCVTPLLSYHVSPSRGLSFPISEFLLLILRLYLLLKTLKSMYVNPLSTLPQNFPRPLSCCFSFSSCKLQSRVSIPASSTHRHGVSLALAPRFSWLIEAG